MNITFDHTITTSLAGAQLWDLLEQSFRNSDASPIWPHNLESICSAQVETGALVRATYKGPAGIQSHVTYRFAEVEAGRQLSYMADPSHPLRGGGTVEILSAPAGCVLHWFGSYDVPRRPAALAAAAFTRLYFTGRFFATLESKLGEWEAGKGIPQRMKNSG